MKDPFSVCSLATLSLLAGITSLQAAVIDFTGAFAPSNWTSTPAGGSSLSHSSTTLTLAGPNSGSGNQTARVSLTLSEAGTVQFHYAGSTADSNWSWDSVGYSVNGVSTQLNLNSGSSPISGNVNLALNSGDILRCFVQSDDSFGGAATLTVSSFSFTAVPEPAAMTALSAASLLGFVAWRRLQRKS